MLITQFHSTPESFRRFDTSGLGVHFGTREQALNLQKPGKKRLIEVTLNLRNPFRVPDLGKWTFNSVHTHLSTTHVITTSEADEIWDAWQRTDHEGWHCLKQVLGRHGYDSFVYANEKEGPGDSYVAFFSPQIRIQRSERIRA